MKKLLLAMITVFILFSITMLTAFADSNEISVYLDANKIEFDVAPQIIDGRTMVPIRAIFEKMGATVEWDKNTSTATCTKDDTVVKMTVNSANMQVNGEIIKMDTAPVVIGGRTLAPARYVAEAFGADVQWSAKNNTVVICSKNVYGYADYPDIPDLGRCYNIPLLLEKNQGGYEVLAYIYKDKSNDEYYSYLYDNSALVLGEYDEEAIDYTDDGILTIAYTKAGEKNPRYYILSSYNENGHIVFTVMIPNETVVENKVTLYASDGRTITVTQSEVLAYKNAGWYETYSEAQAANKTINSSPASNNPSADDYYYRTPNGKKYHLDPNCGGKNSYRTTDISGLSPCLKCAV